MFRNVSYALSWVVLTSLSLPQASAQDAATPSGGGEATAAQRALVQQLGDPSLHTRQQAEKKLSGQGASVEAALMEALTAPDAEIRRRARAILTRVRADAPAEDAAVRSGEGEATDALVVLLHLSRKDPKQYGFKLLQENPETLYHSYSFGFVDDEDREAAHAKWAADSKAGVK